MPDGEVNAVRKDICPYLFIWVQGSQFVRRKDMDRLKRDIKRKPSLQSAPKLMQLDFFRQEFGWIEESSQREIEFKMVIYTNNGWDNIRLGIYYYNSFILSWFNQIP